MLRILSKTIVNSLHAYPNSKKTYIEIMYNATYLGIDYIECVCRFLLFSPLMRTLTEEDKYHDFCVCLVKDCATYE